ncbi:MAG: aconitate hydratase [Bdellovibrionaceae bacterium]|nr:aconitate hydratase [Pseudobdellovibrionaceae bacterium]
MSIKTAIHLVESVYEQANKKITLAKKTLNRPFTYAEKILFGHMANVDEPSLRSVKRGESFVFLNPDRVAMQDATAQMAMLQFMLAKKEEAAVPVSIHCDHLIRAEEGESKDMLVTFQENKEVYDFLSASASQYNIDFWKPGAGIIHQVVLENYAFPGGLMIGTDSHTPNAGGLGMLAVGVGGADAVDVMADLDWEIKAPRLLGVKLTGKLQPWSSAKDVILKLCGLLTVKGGTNKIIEYFGDGCESISCTGKATITNMGAELGATCSVFPFDKRMATYLRTTERGDLASLAEEHATLLQADKEVQKNPEKYFDEVVEINLSELEPYIVGPHSPDKARPLSELKKEIADNQWPEKLSVALIGSCTNSSYEDLGRATHLAKQALAAGLKMKSGFFISPGSSQIKKTISRDGQLKVLEEVGAVVLSNACGPCIGQWNRKDIEPGKVNAIVSSFNRNFKSRNDGNPETLSFIAGPEMVMAMGLSGRLDFDPQRDSITKDNGEEFKFVAPQAEELPADGFVVDMQSFQKPSGKKEKVAVNAKSTRLQLLTPFFERKPVEYQNIKVLCKVKGKCTTDHISPAGPWLKFRGHLDNISDNLLIGANNVYTSAPGKGNNLLNGQESLPLPQIARFYKTNNQPWVVIGDENYGEGSSREHAAMTPRHLGAVAVIAKSFARIHETNLKKQGVLPFTFLNLEDYNKIQEKDTMCIKNIAELAEGKNMVLSITHEDDTKNEVELVHSLNTEQIKWFWAGSALNYLRK